MRAFGGRCSRGRVRKPGWRRRGPDRREPWPRHFSISGPGNPGRYAHARRTRMCRRCRRILFADRRGDDEGGVGSSGTAGLQGARLYPIRMRAMTGGACPAVRLLESDGIRPGRVGPRDEPKYLILRGRSRLRNRHRGSGGPGRTTGTSSRGGGWETVYLIQKDVELDLFILILYFIAVINVVLMAFRAKMCTEWGFGMRGNWLAYLGRPGARSGVPRVCGT